MSAKEVNGVVSAGGFRDGFLFSLAIVLTGFVIEAAKGAQGIVVPQWPVNGAVLALFSASIVVTGLWWRENRFVMWLGGIPLGISLIFTLALLSFVGGMLPQEPDVGALWMRTLRLNGIFSSWPFAIAVFFFLFNLGLSLVWKAIPFRAVNLQFILFHAGFWIVLSCGLMGAADLQRVIIPLYEGRSTSRGYEASSKSMTELPFEVYLQSFEMQEYSPQLALYDQQQGRLLPDNLQHVQDIAEGMTVSWDRLTLRVERYLPYGKADSSGVPVPADSLNGMPYVEVAGISGDEKVAGWVSTGSPFEAPSVVRSGSRLIVLIPGAPKKFRSRITIKRDGGEQEVSEILEVNKPVKVNGWKLYQMGYDEQAGRWSALSLVEGVKDPWLPAVYAGFFMILAGNAMFFWKGMKKNAGAVKLKQRRPFNRTERYDMD